MAPDELRALADALEPMAKAPRFEDFDVTAFCAWLRAQADAVPGGWQLVPEQPTQGMLAAAINENCGGMAAVRIYKAMLRAAPATPQPCWCHKCNEGRLVNGIPFAATQMIVCPICGNKRCPHASDHALACTASNDSMAVSAEPQAEPKREPNPDEVICPACTHQFRAIPENVQAQLWALDDVQIEARDALLDFISENGTASEGVQHYLDRYVRAALAAKEQK